MSTPSSKSLCWFCGTRKGNPDHAYTLYFYKDQREKRVVVPRCDHCKGIHNRIVLWQGLAGIAGVLAIGLILPIGGRYGWPGALGSIGLFGAVAFVMMRKAAQIARESGVKMEADYKSQHEYIRRLQEDGWRQTPPRAGGRAATAPPQKKPAQKASREASVDSPERREQAAVLANHLLNLQVGTTTAELTAMFGAPDFSMDAGAAFGGRAPQSLQGVENWVYETPFGQFTVMVKDDAVVDMQSVESVRKKAERNL